MNMKKNYTMPTIHVLDVEIENLLAESDNLVETETTDVGIYDEPMNPSAAMSKEHNGIWD